MESVCWTLDVARAWVFHSDWWLREYWGRAFEVLEVRRPPRSVDGVPRITHSNIVLRKREVELTGEELERISSDEPRELAALQTSLALARQDIGTLGAGRVPGRDPTPLRRLLQRLRHSHRTTS